MWFALRHGSVTIAVCTTAAGSCCGLLSGTDQLQSGPGAGVLVPRCGLLSGTDQLQYGFIAASNAPSCGLLSGTDQLQSPPKGPCLSHSCGLLSGTDQLQYARCLIRSLQVVVCSQARISYNFWPDVKKLVLGCGLLSGTDQLQSRPYPVPTAIELWFALRHGSVTIIHAAALGGEELWFALRHGSVTITT